MATTEPSSVKIGSSTPQPTVSKNTKNKPVPSNLNKPMPWKTFLGLGLILVELWLNTGIIWGVFMLLWAIIGIKTGQTYILEILERVAHPVLFWFTIHLWLLISAFFFMSNHHIYDFCKTLLTSIGIASL